MSPRKKLHIGFIIFLSFLSSYSYSQESLTMTGIGSYTVLDNELFVAILYLDQAYETPNAMLIAPTAKRMEMLITVDKWRQRSFAKTWGRAITLNNDQQTQELLSADIIQFSRILKGPLQYGDKLIISTDGSNNTSISINGTKLMQTSTEGFFNALLKTWIGERPPTEDFKQQMLAIDPELPITADILSRYEYIRPLLEVQRHQETKSWAK